MPPILCSAPLHGITNSSQRRIFKKYGADLVFSEMISSTGLSYKNSKTIKKGFFTKPEKPIYIQVFGNSIEKIVKSARYFESIGVYGINFNCGCPARNMLASGNGGKLLLEPEKLINILSSIKQSVSIPVSLKTRLGFDQYLPLDFYTHLCESTNIDQLIIHGRTVKQGYAGQADWDRIKEIAKSVPTPLIGNGDICDPYTALDRINNYTPAGIMIGRGALSKPWIFSQIKKLLQGKKIRPRFSFNKICELALFHSRLLVKEYTHEKPAIAHMRKHYGWYFTDFPNAASIRKHLMTCDTYNEVKEYLSTIKHEYQT